MSTTYIANLVALTALLVFPAVFTNFTITHYEEGRLLAPACQGDGDEDVNILFRYLGQSSKE